MNNGMNQEFKPLGYLSSIQAGTGFPVSMQGRTSGTYPFFKVGDISRVARVGKDCLGDAQHYIDESDVQSLRASMIPPDAIVFAKIGEAIRQNFFALTVQHCLVDNNAVAVIPNANRIFPRFLLHFLRTIDLYALAEKTTVPSIRKSTLERLHIPTPPLEEQRRIAAILDQAEALRAKRRQALAKLKHLKAELFWTMFGSKLAAPPVAVEKAVRDLPNGWNWRLLTEAARLATGHTPDRKRPEYWNGSIPWISLTDIRRLDGKIAVATTESVTEDGIANSSSVRLPPGTVCFSRTASVGFVTMMGREMATSQDFVNWVCGDDLNPVFLMHALIESRKNLLSLANGSTHRTIYFPTVEQFHCVIPPLQDQRLFAELAEAIDAQEQVMLASLNKLNEESISLQHRAFRGEL